MALTPEPPGLLQVGALRLDSEAVLGFTSHLLRRRAKVAEGGSGRQLLDVAPNKRLHTTAEQDPRGRRPAPEGAGAGAEQAHASGGGGWCRHCHTRLSELKRQAWRLVSDPGVQLRDPCLSALLLDTLPTYRPEASGHCEACAAPLPAPTCQDPQDGAPPMPPAGPDSKKRAWPPGPSVQVSVAPAGLGGALSTVTFQAQQCLEGMWRVSGVHSLLPPGCLAEAAVAAVAVADSVRDGVPSSGPDGVWKAWGRGTCTATLLTPVPAAPGSTSGPSAAASFFIRAVQKLSLASKRKKPPPTPAPSAQGPPTYPTDFRGLLQLCPPPAPPCLLRASKVKESPGSLGKVKVMLRIWPAQGAEVASFLKVDPRKKQVTLYEPAPGPSGSMGPRQAPSAVPRMFAFDAIFPQDSEQAEVCSGAVADVLQSVVSGVDGCIFSFGPTSLGTAYTMLGGMGSQSLGVVPCAISWLFRLLEARRQSSGARFSVSVSALDACGQDAAPRDLLADLTSGSTQDTLSPGVVLQENSGCRGQGPSELRATSAGQAALFLDAALAARGEDSDHSSPLLLTMHVDQQRLDGVSKGAVLGCRSRLHLIHLGSCPEAPGSLSLPALGSVVLALISGARHVPYRDHRLTMLLREPLTSAHCRATMIAHVSAEPTRLAETLSTLTLAARLHRLRRKRPKYASSSSGGDSSCDEGRTRRPPLLRPSTARAPGPAPDCPVPEAEYSSSSEQSCDTVIYVGPGGRTLSDRELSDGEGPPDFVPIVPALGPRHADPLRCRTFAELQERLGCMDRPPPPPDMPCHAHPRTDTGPCLGQDRNPEGHSGGTLPVFEPPLPRLLERTPPMGGSARPPGLLGTLLNGEDELVFTGVGAADSGAGSLQAPCLRPVSIISSINDELDACSISPSPGPDSGLDTDSGLCKLDPGATQFCQEPPAHASRQTLHSSLPRRLPLASPPEDPWLQRAVDLPAPRRVVDGREGAGRATRKPDAGSPVLPLRRGATTLGVTTCPVSRKAPPTLKGGGSPRPGPPVPPTPPVRKSSLEPRAGPVASGGDEDEARGTGQRARAGRLGAHGSLEHSESRTREAPGRTARPGPRLGTPPTSPSPGPIPACRGAPKAVVGSRPPAGGARAPRPAGKAGRGTIMGTKLRAAHSRVHELAGPALPSPYSTVTAPRRPQRRSSGHGSDNSSVLSGELPPAMGRTALFYHSGGSSGYGSARRDSEATGSTSSAPDSLSDSAASPGARTRSLRSPKRRAAGPQKRRPALAPMPDASTQGRKPSLPGQWVDLLPLTGALKEPFEIKVYEIDDVQRLQRHRTTPREDPAEATQELNKGQRQRLREVLAWRERLRAELAETQGRLMLEPGRWLEQFEVGPELEPGSVAYLEALENIVASLQRRLDLCKARVMMVTCFDVHPGPQQLDI